MRVFSLIFLLIVVIQMIYGCDSNIQSPISNIEEKIAVLEFEIDIALTESASNQLKSSGEFIKGVVHFDGDGLPLPGIKTAPFREVTWAKWDLKQAVRE